MIDKQKKLNIYNFLLCSPIILFSSNNNAMHIKIMHDKEVQATEKEKINRFWPTEEEKTEESDQIDTKESRTKNLKKLIKRIIVEELCDNDELSHMIEESRIPLKKRQKFNFISDPKKSIFSEDKKFVYGKIDKFRISFTGSIEIIIYQKSLVAINTLYNNFFTEKEDRVYEIKIFNIHDKSLIKSLKVKQHKFFGQNENFLKIYVDRYNRLFINLETGKISKKLKEII